MMDYHIPVLLKESIGGLNIKPDGVYVDVTYGGGGHAGEILKRLKKGKLIAFDQDVDAEANITQDKKLLFVRQNFRFLKNFLKYYNIASVDGIIADLGVSSHQLDEPKRGFSFRFDGVLDMRMNKDAGFSAIELVNSYPREELIRIFAEYGEVKNPGRLSDTIIRSREKESIRTVRQLVNSISACCPPKNEHKFLAKIFQALRIEVNREIERIKEFLEQSKDVIAPGGRLVVITYHSLEDRVVKNFIKKGKFEGELEKDVYGNAKVPFISVNNKVIVPGTEEIEKNNRARSAKLRIAERVKD